MSTLTELGDYLQSHGIGSQDTRPPSLYLATRPDDPDDILILTPYPGGPPEYVQDSTFPNCERVQIQVVARGKRYQDAEILAAQAWSALAVITNATLSGTYYRSVRPNASPAILGHDPRNRVLVYFNMSVEKEVSDAAVS